MAEKFSVSVELSASDLASPVIKRARDTYADFGDEIGRTLRQAGIRVRDFNDETKKLDNAANTLKTLFTEGKLTADQYANAMAQVTARQKALAREMGATTKPAKELRGSVASLTSEIKSRLVVTLGDLRSALSTVVQFFRGFIDSAIESEDAVARLDASLTRLGPSAFSVSRELQAQAQQLQQTTRFSDEAVLSAQALLATMNASADQIPKATKVATDLAATLRIDLNQAAELLGRTLQGVVSKQLRFVVPELKSLSKESLLAGEAITITGDALAGRAAADAKTASGAIAQLANEYDNLKEQLGNAVIGSDEFRQALEKIKAAAKDPATVNSVQVLADEVARFIQETTDPEKGLPSIPKDIQRIGDFFRGLSQTFGDALPTEKVRETARATAELNEEAGNFFTRVANRSDELPLFVLFQELGRSIRNGVLALKDWALGVADAGQMMRELGVGAQQAATTTDAFSGSAKGAATASRDLGSQVVADTTKLRTYTREVNNATSALRQFAAQRAASPVGGNSLSALAGGRRVDVAG